MAFGRKQDNASGRVRDSKVNPALLAVKGLLGGHFEAKLFSVELECACLVARWDADKL